MSGPSHFPSRSAPLYSLVLLFLTLVLTHILPAQTRVWQKATHHFAAAESHSSFTQKVPDQPLFASRSHLALAPFSGPRENSPLFAAVAPAPASYHQPVNLNLLLPPSTERLFFSPPASTSARGLILPSGFAEPSDPSNDEAAIRFTNRLNDPQFYARHIPGAGPIVDRVLKESRAHPRLTRVLGFIQPQF
jgi:hypothetical protein